MFFLTILPSSTSSTSSTTPEVQTTSSTEILVKEEVQPTESVPTPPSSSSLPSEPTTPSPESKKKKTKKSSSKKERRKSCERWTQAEDELLIKAIEKYGEKNWNKIAKIVESKNGDQCNQHWHRVLNPKISKKAWSAEEDELLYKRVEEFGESAWKTVAEGFVGRTDIQCRHRFMMLKKYQGKDKQPAARSRSTPSKRKRVKMEEDSTTEKSFEQDLYCASSPEDSEDDSLLLSSDQGSPLDCSEEGSPDEIFEYACPAEFDNPLSSSASSSPTITITPCDPIDCIHIPFQIPSPNFAKQIADSESGATLGFEQFNILSPRNSICCDAMEFSAPSVALSADNYIEDIEDCKLDAEDYSLELELAQWKETFSPPVKRPKLLIM